MSRLLPSRLRRSLDLDGAAVDPLRVELGSGLRPTPGYVHVDQDRRARHLEYVAPVWELPFGSGSVTEILAIHVLEHVHPARVPETLREWRRVLRPGGFVQIHVPNGPEVFSAFMSGDPPAKWALSSAIFGMDSSADITGPDDLSVVGNRPDHKAVYDFALLEDVLSGAGFSRIEDLTDEVVDHHTEGWRRLVPHMSLVVRAFS